ncbi:MAG TPA: 2-phospho-L-lactate transferase [Actinomycetota bacterium]|nr:2-phospho-L-lactate transferase [Actinomycetota bacterium]
MRVAALAGGIGAGKFLRGLVRAADPSEVTVIVNTGDDIVMHGLHVSPDLDSVTYWLGDVFDRARGWGRRDESFRATRELASFDPGLAWFNLGDLDLATHLYRTARLGDGATLSEATASITARFGIAARLLPMSDDPVTTRIEVVADGEPLDLNFQEYWVRRRARDDVKAVRYAGAETARPGPEVLEALDGADAIVLCPSNPVASLGPILAVPGIREAVARRREVVVGVSGIVGGAPLAGMADRLMPAVGLEVTAAGAAAAYDGLLHAWVIDDLDASLAPRIETTGVRVAVTDSIMRDDDVAEALARTALSLVP